MTKNWALIAIIGILTFLLSIISTGYAWHENLGIDANKAAELYKTNPSDPAIVQWKNTLQLAINSIGKCFDIKTAITNSCQTLMATVTSNCNSHPNELLACNDARIPQYPSFLKYAKEEHIKAQKESQEFEKKMIEAQKKNEAEFNQSSLKFEKCLDDGGTLDTCKLKNYTSP